jgi:hypothetical protein
MVLMAVIMKTMVFWDVVPCSLVEVDISEELAAFIIRALMMEAASTSETSANFYHTIWRNIQEDSHLHVGLIVSVHMFQLQNSWMDFDEI